GRADQVRLCGSAVQGARRRLFDRSHEHSAAELPQAITKPLTRRGAVSQKTVQHPTAFPFSPHDLPLCRITFKNWSIARARAGIVFGISPATPARSVWCDC